MAVFAPGPFVGVSTGADGAAHGAVSKEVPQNGSGATGGLKEDERFLKKVNGAGGLSVVSGPHTWTMTGWAWHVLPGWIWMGYHPLEDHSARSHMELGGV